MDVQYMIYTIKVEVKLAKSLTIVINRKYWNIEITSIICTWTVKLTFIKRGKTRKDWFIAIGWQITGSIWRVIFTQFDVRHPNNKTHGKRLQDIFSTLVFSLTPFPVKFYEERIFLLIFKSSWIAFLSTSPQESINCFYHIK